MPDSSVGRRGVLASAAALAGLVGLGAVSSLAAAPAAAASENRRNAAPNYHGSPAAFEPMIIEGGTLIDPKTGESTEDAVVVLDRGKVLAAGSRDATSEAVRRVAATARRIDAGGRFIVPGLVDAHVHNNTLEDARLVLSHGATTVRSGSSSFYQDIALAALPEWAPGLAPRMHAAGLFVSPQLGDSVLADPALVPLAGLKQGLHDPRDLAYLTRVNIERGASVIKTRANPRAGIAEQDPLELVYDREQLASIVSAARGAGVLCHAYSAEGIAGAVAAGVRSIEHGVFVSERTLAQMARRGTYFTPTLTGVAAMSGSSNPVLAERGREYTPVLQVAIRAAADAGVRVVAGTDSFGTDVIPIGTEAWNLQEAGLTALQALQSVTTNAASLLGMEGKVGRLIRGALPDVVLLEANPLESAAALERVSTIIAQGRVVGEE